MLMAQKPLQWVTVKGNAPEYAGYSLVMQKVINPISFEMRDIMVIKVNEDGSFEQRIEISDIIHASIDMGRYKGYLYLEPGKTYDLVMPPFHPRTDAERFNPYYVPEVIVLGIKNEDAQGLNRQITSFDEAFLEAYNADAVKLFARGDKRLAEKIIADLDSIYPSDDVYFNKYKQYAYGELLSLAYKRNKRKAMHRTMQGNLNMSMPSFHKVFNSFYKGFFSYYFSSPQGKNLRDAYGKGASYDSLATVLKQDTLFANEELAELVLLKGLYDAYYSGRYEQDPIIDLYKQAQDSACTLMLRDIAKGLYKKVTWLRVGTEAPPFTLYRLDGKERSLSDYEGKFVYLNFMHTQNHTCKEELQLLNVISKQMRREVTIVTIIMDEDLTAANKLVKDNKYKWDFLHFGAMPKVALDYQIRALPAYFVVNPSQKLSLSPSPSPNENFMPIFIEAQRKYNYEELRKNRPKSKNIYDF